MKSIVQHEKRQILICLSHNNWFQFIVKESGPPKSW